MAFVLLTVAAGCNREHYRQQADSDAAALIAEKSDDPRWGLDGFSIRMDPRSRLANVHDPDRPPMPPDDPASHRLMHYIDGKEHFDGWHDDGDVHELENPAWRESLPEYVETNEKGQVRLSLDSSMQLALLHSADYQEELETLYLSALDVSTERFRFDVQFFGGNETSFRTIGEERPGGGSSLLRTDTDARIERQFATAGQLLVEFANSFTWQFFGANNSTAMSVLNFSFVQPLLRAGGRAVALEQLTIAERGLLSNLRAFQRFRQGFFTDVAIGESGVSGPQRRGGFFGGTGLTGFTGQGSGGFGGVGDVTGFGNAFGGGGGAAGGGGGAGFAGGGAGTVGGFIGLLQQLQQIRNTQGSLEAQLRTLALLEASLDAGLIDIAQVDQFRQNIETERANLLQSRNSLQSSLDRFKRTTLGLPPNLPVTLDDTMIQKFQLITPSVKRTQRAITGYIDEFGQLPLEPSPEELGAAFERVEELRQTIAEDFDRLPEDLRQFDEHLAERERDLTEAEQRLLERDRRRLDEHLKILQEQFAATATQLDELRSGLTDENRQRTADGVVELLTTLSGIVNELSLIQARARLESITVRPIQVQEPVAMAVARANRLDWMNNRAALVDTWRLIQFNANALKSDVSIRFDGDLQTQGNNNPIDFRGQAGSLSASLEIDPPFTRLIERNNFRQQLIEYQQDRRRLIGFEDQVRQNLRDLLRTLHQLDVNLEIQRRAVAIAIRRVDQTREALQQPVPPAEPGQLPSAFGPTAAQNLLFALSDLRNTQNNFMSVWLNYQATRMRLFRELGVMRVDHNNMWVDVPLDEAIGDAGFHSETQAEPDDAQFLPPEVPQQWFDQLDQLDQQAEQAEQQSPDETNSRDRADAPRTDTAPRLLPPPDDKAPDVPADRDTGAGPGPGVGAGPEDESDAEAGQAARPRPGRSGTASDRPAGFPADLFELPPPDQDRYSGRSRRRSLIQARASAAAKQSEASKTPTTTRHSTKPGSTKPGSTTGGWFPTRAKQQHLNPPAEAGGKVKSAEAD